MKIKAAIKRVCNFFLSILAVLLILLVGAVLFCKANHRVFFLFGRAPVWVLTESMEDTIPRKSFILIRQVSSEEVKVGDIITFYSSDPALGGALNTHRVVGIREDSGNFVTKGDHPAALTDAYEVPPENVVGIYVCSLPFLTIPGRILQTSYGICLVFSMALLIGLICCLPTLKKMSAGKNAAGAEDLQKTAEINRLVAAEVERLKKEGLSASGKPDQKHETKRNGQCSKK